VYQSDLCRVLADALIHYSSQPDRTVVQLQFDCGVSNVDLVSNTITVTETTRVESSTAASVEKTYRVTSSYDLIVGCDGVNSVVRRVMQDTYGPVGFQSTATPLPGVYKVARLPRMPPQLDRTAVQLLLPKSGSATVFLEPVVDEGCCLLIAGNNETDVLLKSYDNLGDNARAAVVITIEEELRQRFPQMQGDETGLHEAAVQLATARPGRASKVSCNIYHARSACLVGDAAHATGGVSGQGLNSALVDVNVLVDCLLRRYQQDNDDEDDDTATKGRKAASLHAALLEYRKAPPWPPCLLVGAAMRGRPPATSCLAGEYSASANRCCKRSSRRRVDPLRRFGVTDRATLTSTTCSRRHKSGMRNYNRCMRPCWRRPTLPRRTIS
jgi:2-polyprenyl-6-methoxyphenol hydroxylase-like FAD-dependent oxidoreductase